MLNWNSYSFALLFLALFIFYIIIIINKINRGGQSNESIPHMFFLSKKEGF